MPSMPDVTPAPRERIAEIIYNAMLYGRSDLMPPWAANGNSFPQEYARERADEIMAVLAVEEQP